MNHEDFGALLQSAIAGNKKDVEELLRIYSPLIDSNSIIKGKLDENLRQYLLLHIFKNLNKFKI